MRKIIFFTVLGFLLLSQNVNAQSFGLSAAFTGYIPAYTQQYITDNGPNVNTAFVPGFRLEANLIIPDAGFPGSGFNGIGVSFSSPIQDSVTLWGWDDYQRTSWRVPASTHYTNISLRFGYIIPQEISDFLMFHVGWGMGTTLQKSKYTLPNFDPATCTLDNSDIDVATMTEHHRGFEPEIIAGAMYEFEKFSVFGQYSFRFNFGIGDKMNFKFQNVVNAGIYVPLKRF